MNIDFTLGIIGLCGGILCAVADVFLDYKGKGNEQYGPHGIINSNWAKMSMWRFNASIWVAAVAIPMYLCGLVAMYRQLEAADATLAGIFGICSLIGGSGTLFIHATLCYIPIIEKTLTAEKASKDAIGATVSALYNAMMAPFMALWLLLTVGLSGIVIYATLAGILRLPLFFIALTPLCLVLISLLLRLINKKIFADLPGICMPSIGIGMVGLMAAINALAA